MSEPPRVLEVDAPEPGPGQVKVKVAWSAVNRADLRVSSGEFVGRLLHARIWPLIVGYDFSGSVEGGPGIGDLRAGDEVFGFLPYASATRQGAFAEFVAIDRGAVGLKPQSVSDEAAAAAATPGLTALQFLRDLGRLKAGGKVLVIGAAGGVGSLAVGVAKRLGAHVTAVCSTYAVDYVRGLGADVVVDRRKRDPLAVEGPFDVVFDPAAAHSYLAFRNRIAARGAFVSTVPSPALLLGKAMAALSLKRCEFGSVKPVSADFEQLAVWLQSGLQAPVDSRFPVKNLGAALAQLTRGELRGRIAVQVHGGF
ncbi:MAG TPA: NAD(P)-dependent alcohol dehydrogenase [Roseiarcus sp.]|nr:NAD(P)-dependent alcohol dehydrogenase [Roseiarcus sp.]